MDTRDLIEMLEICSEVKPVSSAKSCEGCLFIGEENCQEKLMRQAANTLRRETGYMKV